MTITSAERPHGYARYKLGSCRCYTCCFAVSEYNRKRDEAITAGTWRADTAPVRIHLRSLMVAGMGYKLIAKRAGVATSTVGRILYGRPDLGTPPPATTRYDIAAKLLAVQHELHPNSPIEATGTVRRVQALVAIGHTLTAIAEAIGWTVQNFTRVVREGSVPYACRVEVRTAQAVAALYDQLSMTRPAGLSADKARRYAARQGWFPPLAWEDDQLDDPVATPSVAPAVEGSDLAADELVLQHAAASHAVHLDPITRVELVRRLTAAGAHIETIAALAQTTVHNVGRIRSDHHISARKAAA